MKLQGIHLEDYRTPKETINLKDQRSKTKRQKNEQITFTKEKKPKKMRPY